MIYPRNRPGDKYPTFISLLSKVFKMALNARTNLPDHPASELLGFHVTDNVTGCTGYITSIVMKGSGMVQCAIQPKGDGVTYPEPWTFDHNNLVVNNEIPKLAVTPFKQMAYPVLSKIKSIATGFEGSIIDISWSVNGCIVYGVSALGKKNEIKTHAVAHEVAEPISPKEEEKAPEPVPVKKTGGPSNPAMRL